MDRSFQICAPSENDAGRIASIHLRAMDSNPLLHVQFPGKASLERLEAFLEAHTVQELRDPKVGVLVVRDTSSNDIVGFTKWDYPSFGESEDVPKLETGDLKNLQGCRRDFLERYAESAERAKKRSFGDQPCYRKLCDSVGKFMRLMK